MLPPPPLSPSPLYMPFEILTGNKLCVTNIKLSLTITHGTPIDTEKKLGPEGSPITDPTLYRSYPAMRQSTSGYYVFLGDNLLTWSSKRQDMLPHSSDEAEYRGVTNAVAETSWIRILLRELHTPLFTATLVYYDNVSAVYMSANPVQHQRTKHIEIDIHFVCDKVAAGHVQVLHVPSRFQYADIFTKGLPYPLFPDFRSSWLLSIVIKQSIKANQYPLHGWGVDEEPAARQEGYAMRLDGSGPIPFFQNCTSMFGASELVKNANLKWKELPSMERHAYCERLSKLQGKEFGMPRVADWNLFYGYNFDETLKNKMKFQYIHSDGDVFEDYSWERAFSISGDVYPEWCLEFFSTMYFDKGVDRTKLMTEKCIWFRLCGHEQVLALP
ncbi:ribonuclease H-like domain-containing protein [Tanacetum coccineum]